MAEGHTHQAEVESKTLFGFWIYLMTDCVLFAAFFATYFVLKGGTYGGPSGLDIFNLPYELVQTMALLVSSFTCGLAMWGVRTGNKKSILVWFGVTFLFGALFLGLEINEFILLLNEGYSWQTSAFLSSFYMLIATHGAHITVGLLWMGIMMTEMIVRGLRPEVIRRLRCLRLFWHFLDVVWIFIFTFIFLMEFIQ